MSKDIDRPFEDKIWIEAKKIAERYNIRIKGNSSLGYVANSIEMPTVWADGLTPNTCLKASIEAHTVAVATILELGDELPIPMKDRPLEEEEVQIIPSFLNDVLPPVRDEDVPPMPKCKPPKEEDRWCSNCIYVFEADGWSGLSCNHHARTGCTGHYQACDFYEYNDDIKIENVDQIIDKLTNDGDYRNGDFDRSFVCKEDDDLGFYQQACAFLLEGTAIDGGKEIQTRLTANAEDFDSIIVDILKKLATIQTCEKGHQFVANSHEYVCPWCVIEKTRNKLS